MIDNLLDWQRQTNNLISGSLGHGLVLWKKTDMLIEDTMMRNKSNKALCFPELVSRQQLMGIELMFVTIKNNSHCQAQDARLHYQYEERMEEEFVFLFRIHILSS